MPISSNNDRIHLCLRFLIVLAITISSRVALTQDDPKLNELQSYVRNLDSVKSYVCRAYFFRFGTEQYQRDGVLHSFTFVTSKVCDLVADLSIDSQISFENKRMARNVEDFASSNIHLKVGAKVFERAEMKGMAQRDSTMVFGPFNPLIVGMGIIGDLSYYADPKRIEKDYGRDFPVVQPDERAFGSYGGYLVFEKDGNGGPIRTNIADVRVATTYKTIDGIVLPSRAYLESKREGLWIELDWIAINCKVPPELLDAEEIRPVLQGKGFAESELQELTQAFSLWRSSANRTRALPTSIDPGSNVVKACSPMLTYRSLMCSLDFTGSTNAFEQYGQLRKTSSLELAKDQEQLRGGNYEKLGPFLDECIRQANINDGPFEEMFDKDVEGQECKTILFRYLRKHGPAGLLHPECVTRLAITQEQQKALEERINDIRIFQRLLWAGKVSNVSPYVILRSCSMLNQLALVEDLMNETQRLQLINFVKGSNDRQHHFSLGL